MIWYRIGSRKRGWVVYEIHEEAGWTVASRALASFRYKREATAYADARRALAEKAAARAGTPPAL